MEKVNFLICGTQKGGTTALYYYLSLHPHIGVPENNKKEVHFFDNEHIFNGNLKADYNIYHSYFDFSDSSKKIFGEATPIYMYWDSSPQRIYNYNPDMKIIIILRNPIERAFSHWYMSIRRKEDDYPFDLAVRLEKNRLKVSGAYGKRVYSYVDRGFYLGQIKNMQKFFSEKNMLILLNEELRFEHKKTLKRVFDFLRIDDISEEIEPQNVYAQNYKYKIEPKTREYLREIYKEEISNLEIFLGKDLSSWK